MPFVAGVAGVYVGLYCFGAALENLRSFLAYRRIDPVDVANVDEGPIVVSGRVVPLEEPIQTPVSGTDAAVLGIAETKGVTSTPTDAESTGDRPTITAGETGTEVVVTPGCEGSADRHFIGSIVGCGAASVALLAGGLWILGTLAGIR